MKKIAFYISSADNRRASANRCSAIINTLFRLEEEIEVFIVSDQWVVNLLKGFLSIEERVHYYIEETEEKHGARFCVSAETGDIIWNRTEQLEEEYIDKWDEMIEKAEDFLTEKGIGLVVSDLCPWILAAADNLRIRSILISDFTWDQVYEGMLSEDICDSYRECYESASKVIAYDVHHPEMEHIAEDYHPVSLMARPYDMELIGKLRSETGQPLVFLDLDVDFYKKADLSLEGLPYCFIILDADDQFKSLQEGDNVMKLDAGHCVENLHNYIAACDYVIARPEWDIAAGALLANKKAAYWTRKDMPVEINRVALLKERCQCVEIGREDLNDIGGILKWLDEMEYSYDVGYHNDDYDVAKIILNYYPRKRRRRKDEN